MMNLLTDYAQIYFSLTRGVTDYSPMSQHGQTTVKQPYYDRFKHRNNLCCYNLLIFGNSIEITKISIMK